MNYFERVKLHEICESVKETYLLNSIEENANEIEVLRTKKFLTETFNTIEKLLIEEAIADGVKKAAIIGAAGLAGTAAGYELGHAADAGELAAGK